MPSVNTYQIYISGTLANPTFSGDIDPQNHRITPALGSGVIVIHLSQLVNVPGGEPLKFDPVSPITFPLLQFQPGFVAWALLKPTQLLVTDMNSNNQCVEFSLNTEAGSLFTMNGRRLPGIDPTIVNTYVPPTMIYPAAAPGSRRIA